MKIEFIPVRTRVVKPPKDDIYDIIDSLDIRDGDVVFITSKIISIHQGRTCKIGDKTKEDLIRQEAERFLPYVNDKGDFHVNLTVTQDVLIPAAGIDESNADGYYIMWPKEIDKFCQEIRQYLMKKYNVPKENVVRHFDISGKHCPGIIGWNDFNIYTKDGKQTTYKSNSSEWEHFKSQL